MCLNDSFLLKFDYNLGGFDGEHTLNTTKFIHLNGSKTEGPIELPEPRSGHCMVEYAGIVISTGGEYVTHYNEVSNKRVTCSILFWISS